MSNSDCQLLSVSVSVTKFNTDGNSITINWTWYRYYY